MPPLCHSCCGPLGQVCGTVLGCNSATVGGTTVYLLDSTNAVVSSVVANGSGAYCLPFYAAGSYKVKSDAPTSPVGYLAATAALNSYTSGTTTGRNVTLAVDTANYLCTACCSYPVKKVLALATPNGAATATYNPSATPARWEGSRVFSGTTLICDPLNPANETLGTGNYTAHYYLTCISPGNVWRFQLQLNGRYYSLGTAACCDHARWVYADDTNTTGCGGSGYGGQIPADQSCSAGPFDMIFAIADPVTLICQNCSGSTTSITTGFGGNYEFTF